MVLELIKEAVEDLMNNSGRSFDYIRNAQNDGEASGLRRGR
jgi:hypothetical protein